MTRPLTEPEKETLARFDKWLKKLFPKSLLGTYQGISPVFSTSYHIDQWGNILIDNGRMKLVPPPDNQARWEIQSLEDNVICALEITLEQALLAALSKALKRDFANRY